MTTRFWIRTLAVLAITACVLALFFATPRADAGAAAPEPQATQEQSPADQSQTYEGIITDTHCGAKHSAAVGLSAADCTRACVHSGEHFALVDGDKTYALQGEDAAIKRVAGQRVKIVGTLNGNTISVASVTAAAS